MHAGHREKSSQQQMRDRGRNLSVERRCSQVGYPGMLKQFGSGGTGFMIELKRAIEEVRSIRRDVCGDCWFCTHTDLGVSISSCCKLDSEGQSAP